jgi:hypothetical protein
MVPAECALAYRVMKKVINVQSSAAYGTFLNELSPHMHLEIIFLIAFVLLSAAILYNGSAKGVQYTLGRLSGDERVTTILWGGYYALCYFIFWAFQVVLAYGILSFCAGIMPEGQVTGQSVLLAFYGDEFLHEILPLSDGTRYFTNICYCISLGVTAACFSHMWRRGKKSFGFVAITAMAINFFKRDIGKFWGDISLGLISLVIMGWSIARMWKVSDDEAKS